MKSNFEWEKWGEIDPLYAVATWEGKQRGTAGAWTDEEFYNLGRSDWADFVPPWKNYGLTMGNCLEIGCGAGRITRQLSDCFQAVTAADVSKHQLDYAQTHIPNSNVTYLLMDGLTYPLPDQSFDAIFSVFVFQHFESHEDAWTVFHEIFRLLRPGGTIMIQLPLYVLPDMKISLLFRPLIACSKMLSDFKASLDRRAMRAGREPTVMRRLRFEREALAAVLTVTGFEKLEFHAFSVRSNAAQNDFVFARRSL